MKRLVAAAVIGLLATSCVGTPDSGAEGEEIYLQLCSNCHGAELQGGLGPALGRGSNAAGQPDDFLRVTITDGRGRMPSFSSTLTDSQVERLIAYLRQEQAG
ncbi:MAG TPA: cytochrome c [Acidimicrobiia bacterium]|nr:cytochrome c [Acidimicrobiia bacterium]